MSATSATKKTTKKTADDSSAVSKTIHLILERAVKTGASDVHIEPRPGYGVVRQRIDGLLQVTTKLPGASFSDVVIYIKKLGGLNTAQRQAPQFGQYKLSLGRRSYDVQVATLPIMDGERITLHIADAQLQPTTLPELGFWGAGLNAINHALVQPHGLIVVGSADQTSRLQTLASMLRTLNSPHLNLASVEQDQLYQLPNVNQTVVKKDIGMTFARRLKQTLDHEPDVVMISDVLDKRTAKTIVRAASERQLVLAGTHAGDVANDLNGLLLLSGEPLLLAAALRVAVSQQMVTKLCEECRESYAPDSTLNKRLATIFGTDNSARMIKLHQLETEALHEGLGVNESQPQSATSSTTEQHITRLWRARVGGCKNCNHNGLCGRVIISEIVPVSDTLQAGLQKATDLPALRKATRGSSTIPMALDALVKALRGMLPIETVLASTKS
jgi:type IV pilus assembly protein PilB